MHAATWWLPPRASGAQAASSRAPRPPAMVVVWDLPRLRICWRAGPAPPAPGCERAAPVGCFPSCSGVCSEKGMFFLSRPSPVQSPALPSQPYESLPNIVFPSALSDFRRGFR